MSFLKIRLSKSCVGEREKEALAQVVEEGYLGMGRVVGEFEAKLKEYLPAEHVVCVSSGTAALHLALLAVGCGRGDEVLVPSMTYVASFQAIAATGARPVPCEVRADDGTLDLDDVKRKLTPKAKAVMPVHYAGQPCDLEGLYALARKHHLRVVEDAAHAFGSFYKGEKIGSFGDVVCFSFDGIKNITSGEGGTIVTGDERVASFAKDARLLGVRKDTKKRLLGKRSWEFEVEHIGFRYHMSNLFGAIGLVQLQRFEKEFKPKRQELARKYFLELSKVEGLALFQKLAESSVVPHIFPLRVLHERRDELRSFLQSRGIECGIHYYPNHLHKFFGGGKERLPVTEKLWKELLTLPLHPELRGEEQDFVIASVKEFLQ